mgnify:CR=1 FL=1
MASAVRGILGAIGSDLRFVAVAHLDAAVPSPLPSALLRTTALLGHPVFNRCHSETEMRRYLRVEIAEQARIKGPRQALVDALFSKGELKLEYDAERTRNAA